MGIGLALITVMYAPFNQANGNTDHVVAYFTSVWMLPTVLFAYGIGEFETSIVLISRTDDTLVILLDTILVAFVRKAVHRKSSVGLLPVGNDAGA